MANILVKYFPKAIFCFECVSLLLASNKTYDPEKPLSGFDLGTVRCLRDHCRSLHCGDSIWNVVPVPVWRTSLANTSIDSSMHMAMHKAVAEIPISMNATLSEYITMFLARLSFSLKNG